MPTFDFTSPDGKTFSVQGPDGATPEQAFQILQSHLGAPAADSSDGSTLGGIAKSLGVGAGEGLIGLAGLGGDLANLASKGYDYLTGSNTNASVAPYANVVGSQNIRNQIEKLTGPFYQPKGTGEQVAQTIGQFLPAAAGGPEGLATRLATRVAAPALASETAGQLTKGTSFEPAARVIGAVAGAGLPVAASRILSPTTVDATNAAAVKTLQDAGVNALTAGQKSGSKIMKYMESELGDSLGAGNQATNRTELAHQQFTQAVLGRAGVAEPLATTDTINQAFDANSNLFKSLVADNPVIPIKPKAWNDLADVQNEYENLTGAKSPLLSNLVERLRGNGETEVPISAWPKPSQPLVTQLKQQGVSDADIAKTLGVQIPKPATANPQAISGATYQSIQSDMARYARSASQPELKNALYDLRSTLDDAVGDGLRATGNAQAAQAWDAARQQYKSLLIVSRAVSGSGELAAKGLITPAALHNADKAVTGMKNVARGTSPYSDLARAGNAVMKQMPQSGTAPRSAAHLLPSLAGAALGLGGEHLLPLAGGLVAPAVLGRAIMSRPAQAYLSNQFAVPLRQIPAARNALTGGVLSLPSAQGQSSFPIGMSPAMLPSRR